MLQLECSAIPVRASPMCGKLFDFNHVRLNHVRQHAHTAASCSAPCQTSSVFTRLASNEIDDEAQTL